MGERYAVYRISQEEGGRTVKSYLLNTLRLSGRCLIRLKQTDDGILLNGHRVTVRAMLQTGDTLSLALYDSRESPNIKPAPMSFEILYEDEDLVCINKPPHLPTHPSFGHSEDTVANGMAYLFAVRGEPFVFRCAGRLDRDTSGVLLLAKNQRTAGAIYRLHHERLVKKSYLALLEGIPVPAQGEIVSGIQRKADSMVEREISETGGAPAKTLYKLLGHAVTAEGLSVSAVLATPVTGRTHQLRVHFSSRGVPILGDTLYGKGSASGPIGRQALHAWRLRLPHPTKAEMLSLSAPIPEDMKELCCLCGMSLDMLTDA